MAPFFWEAVDTSSFLTLKVMQGGCRKKLYPIEELKFFNKKTFDTMIKKKPRCHTN